MIELHGGVQDLRVKNKDYVSKEDVNEVNSAGKETEDRYEDIDIEQVKNDKLFNYNLQYLAKNIKNCK